MTRHDRRSFFARLGGFATSLLAASSASAATAVTAHDTTKRQGGPVSAYGVRSRFETIVRRLLPVRYRSSTGSFTPLGQLDGIITPSSLHYERHHGGVPEIDPAAHRLLVHGLVERERLFSMADLRRFPATARLLFLECSGNTGLEWTGPGADNVEETHGLTSCSEWAGVSLAVVLAECGVDPQAAWIVAEGADGAAMTRSVPLNKCLDDVLLAYSQNGEALRPEQGYPLRLIVPGWEGSISVKWLRRLKLTDTPYYTREETSKYTDLMADGSAREFSFVMEAKSVITQPSGSQRVNGPGFHEIRGLAWSGRGTVARVEVTTDNGARWHAAELVGPVLPLCHTSAFISPWQWDGRATVIASRCIDDTGYVQPTRDELRAVRGDHSFYHYNGIQHWRLDDDGQLHATPAPPPGCVTGCACASPAQ